jgi:enolase
VPVIRKLWGLEILDSRGRPTVRATCEFAGGVIASASVPSGASTGAAEAHGLGCRKAVESISGELNRLLSRDIANQRELDEAMLKLDGTPNKSRLGANALLAVSIAFARACALEKSQPLYQHFAQILGNKKPSLPRMTINLFSGGKHAGGQVPIQDVLVVPARAQTIDEGLAVTYAVYQAAAELVHEKYQMRLLRADEGGLAPPAKSAEKLLQDAVQAILAAHLQPGRDVMLAVDVASTHFYDKGRYQLNEQSLDSSGMIRTLRDWVDRYPIVSVEDGLAEDDWSNWPALREAIGGKAIVVGDDFLCTNPDRIRRAIDAKAASALLLKVNQIGTLTEAADACRLARSADWNVTISARSGETEDDWLADLAVGWSGDQIKVGSITQSERLAKYNRLLAIEAETKLPMVKWPN